MPLALLFVLCAAIPRYASSTNAVSLAVAVNEDSFLVAGYSIQTNNADEISGRGRIGRLWQDFFQKNLAATIPDRVDQRLIVVYSDYSSDENGEFTYLLGARVSSIGNLPEGMDYRRIIAGRYAVVTTRRGPLLDILEEAWKRIWAARTSELGGRRAFATDYEVHDERRSNPSLARVEIHIGVTRD
jgi:predicted transcriptional regulator YdeE